MSDRISWDEYFMGIAFAVSQRSEDSSTKHGCVLVAKESNIIIGCGYNGLMRGLSPARVDIQTRPEKYKWMIHSEENALLNTTVIPRMVPGGVKAYVTGRPCSAQPGGGVGCLQKLIQAGINEIFIAERRGYLQHTQEIEDDFNFIVWEKGVLVHYVPLEDVQWLNKIDLN